MSSAADELRCCDDDEYTTADEGEDDDAARWWAKTVEIFIRWMSPERNAMVSTFPRIVPSSQSMNDVFKRYNAC